MKYISENKEKKRECIFNVITCFVSVVSLAVSIIAVFVTKQTANEEILQNEKLVYLENDLYEIQRREEYICGIYEELQNLVMKVKSDIPHSYTYQDLKSTYFTDEYEEAIENFCSITDTFYDSIDEKSAFIDDDIELNSLLLKMSALSLSLDYHTMCTEHSKWFKGEEYDVAVSDFEEELSEIRNLANKIKTQIDNVLSDYFGLEPAL